MFVLGHLYHGRRAQICDVKVFAIVLEQVCEFGDHGIESVLVIFLIHQLGNFDGDALFEGMASQMTFLFHMLAITASPSLIKRNVVGGETDIQPVNVAMVCRHVADVCRLYLYASSISTSHHGSSYLSHRQ